MQCEVEDTRVLTIPSEYIDELISFGVTAPTIGIIERPTVDSTEIDLGCIEFRSVSRFSTEVELADSVN